VTRGVLPGQGPEPLIRRLPGHLPGSSLVRGTFGPPEDDHVGTDPVPVDP